jgi:hypothetical protein
MLVKGSKIPRIELNTINLYEPYSLFMHNTLQYTWRGDYCECVRPAQLTVLTWDSSSVPPRTTSTIRTPPGPRRIQQPFDIDQVYSIIHTKIKSNISPLTLAEESSARTDSGSITNFMWTIINNLFRHIFAPSGPLRIFTWGVKEVQCVQKVSIYLVKIKRIRMNNEIV